MIQRCVIEPLALKCKVLEQTRFLRNEELEILNLCVEGKVTGQSLRSKVTAEIQRKIWQQAESCYETKGLSSTVKNNAFKAGIRLGAPYELQGVITGRYPSNEGTTGTESICYKP